MGQNWFEKVVHGLAEFFERLELEKSQKTIEGILKLILLGCQIAEKFNSPLSGHEKREFVRLLVRLVKYSTPEELAFLTQQMMDLKGGGEIEDLKPYELDKIMGDGLSMFLADRAATVTVTGTGPIGGLEY